MTPSRTRSLCALPFGFASAAEHSSLCYAVGSCLSRPRDLKFQSFVFSDRLVPVCCSDLSSIWYLPQLSGRGEISEGPLGSTVIPQVHSTPTCGVPAQAVQVLFNSQFRLPLGGLKIDSRKGTGFLCQQQPSLAFFFSALLFRATPPSAAYVSFQARGPMGATASGLPHSHGNAGSLTLHD